MWRNRCIKVNKVISAWQDWGFAHGSHNPDWRLRRHRNTYLVEGDDDRFYEIYFDRSHPDKGGWFLYRIIENDDINRGNFISPFKEGESEKD